ncbi:MAG: 16S rRNA (adenine(1518)-N(6)/adenine(1519)-N(6))-dimethyltransferase RsmA [Candidatus Sericytochromatia bacterium]
MRTYEHRPKKRWGQNFFQAPDLLLDALAPLQLGPEDVVLEIGPGHGVLTELLLERVSEVLALEIDPELCRLLKQRFADQPRLKLRHLDVMNYEPADFHPQLPLARRKLIANIPYNLTSPILMKVLNEPGLRQGITAVTPFFADICLMVQKEVAEKLLAKPGTKAWNALSATVKYAADTSLLAELPRELFDPMPQVDSALIRLQPHTVPPILLKDPASFWQLLSRIFQLRRKTLRNVVKSLGIDDPDPLSQLTGIDLARRGETLDLEELASLANGISQVTGNS